MNRSSDSGSVMVIEDDSAIRETIAMILRCEGYEVDAVAAAREALRHLRAGARPGVILLDLRMPGMDGEAFARELRRDPELGHTPIVILSGDQDASVVATTMQAEGCLRKPIELHQLLAVARAYCGAPPPSAVPPLGW
jgi:CheY-like chemotaxis protein